MEYSANINGINVSAYYSDETVREVFIPLLEHLEKLHAEKQRRILVMLAAPPGAGKSTLVGFLEKLAKDVCPGKKIQAIGMDGFHRRQDYLLSHTVSVNGREIPMVNIKGAPVTFDLKRLREKTAELTEGNPCSWPRYDRLLHNPVEDAIAINADIVLLEGNYLLLDVDGWRELSDYADYTISLTADEGLLRDRLVRRRIATGVEKKAAEEFVDFSDMANVRLCLEKTKKADLALEITPDGSEIRKREGYGMEYFDIVDENGLPTGKTVSREEAHQKGIPHRTSHVWIVRPSDTGYDILLQKRSEEKDSFPGMFDTSSAGHIPAGDEPLPSAIRELEEELGIKAKPEDLRFAGTFRIQYEKPFHGRIFRDNEFANVYVYSGAIGKLKLQESEVSEVRWFDLDEVWDEIQTSRERFCVPKPGLAVLRDYLKERASHNDARPAFFEEVSLYEI